MINSAGFIDRQIPDHHVVSSNFHNLFSIAGVSKKNAMVDPSFDCKMQGTLFFDICKNYQKQRPACFLLRMSKI